MCAWVSECCGCVRVYTIKKQNKKERKRKYEANIAASSEKISFFFSSVFSFSLLLVVVIFVCYSTNKGSSLHLPSDFTQLRSFELKWKLEEVTKKIELIRFTDVSNQLSNDFCFILYSLFFYSIFCSFFFSFCVEIQCTSQLLPVLKIILSSPHRYRSIENQCFNLRFGRLLYVDFASVNIFVVNTKTNFLFIINIVFFFLIILKLSMVAIR